MVKWYLVRNRSNDSLTLLNLLDSAARGKYKLKGFGSISTTEEELAAHKSLVEFGPHEEKVVKILGRRDKGIGLVCTSGLWTGVRGCFVIQEIESPRNIWTKRDIPPVESVSDE